MLDKLWGKNIKNIFHGRITTTISAKSYQYESFVKIYFHTLKEDREQSRKIQFLISQNKN